MCERPPLPMRPAVSRQPLAMSLEADHGNPFAELKQGATAWSSWSHSQLFGECFHLLLARTTLICAFPSLLTRIEVAY